MHEICQSASVRRGDEGLLAKGKTMVLTADQSAQALLGLLQLALDVGLACAL